MLQTSISTNVNSPRAIAAISLIGVVGASVFIVQPGFVQGLVSHFGLTEAEAGYTAAAEMSGLALSTIALTMLSHKMNWHRMLYIGILLMTLGNLGSPFAIDFEAMMGVRFLTGIGSGILVSLSFGAIGLTTRVDRNFGIYISAVLTYGALGLLVMPAIFQGLGIIGLFLILALIALIALPFVQYMPTHAEEPSVDEASAVDLPASFKVMALAAMFVYFLAQGTVWAYLFMIGLAGGLFEQEVANALMLSQFAGIAGALTATFCGDRFGRIIPLSAGILAGLLSLTVLHGSMSFLVYAAGVSIFNYTWNAVHPYLMASMAGFDRRGRMVIHAVAFQVLGLAFGPSIAAKVIGTYDYWGINLAGMTFFAISLVLILPPLFKYRFLRAEQSSSSGARQR